MGDWGFVLWLIGLSAITFFSVAWLLDISNRQRQLQKQVDQPAISTDPGDLPAQLAEFTARLDESADQTLQLRNDLDRLVDHLPLSIQAVGLIRFQAFRDYGGDQSFALALANAAGDGVVISGIYSREGTRVYAKPLSAWISSYSLSFEEEEAIGQAQSRIQ